MVFNIIFMVFDIRCRVTVGGRSVGRDEETLLVKVI